MVGDPEVATSISCSLTATNCVLTKQHNLREDESTSSEEDSGTARYPLPLQLQRQAERSLAEREHWNEDLSIKLGVD